MRARAAFVCRGSVGDGFGHLIRSSVVALQARERFEVQLFAVGDRSAAEVLAGYDVAASVFDSDEEMSEAVSAFAADVVIWDMVAIDPGIYAGLSDGRLSASLSPIFTALDEVDLAFSRTSRGAGGSIVHDPSRGRFGGVEYAVVRPGCRRIDTGVFARHLDEADLSIAISMGGSDAANHTLAVLDALRRLEAPAVFWAILGEGYAHSYRELVDCVRRDRRHEIILAKTNRSMWRILGNCSLAILAGGVTTYEAAYAGLPSVNVLATPADGFLVADLLDRGAAFDGGVQDDGLELLADVTAGLAGDRERLLASHRAGRSIVDGRGAERIVELIDVRLQSATGGPPMVAA